MFETVKTLTPFVVPLWTCSFPDFFSSQKLFLETVEDFSKKSECVNKSNVGGSYQSSFTLMHEQSLAPLYDFILSQSIHICNSLNFHDNIQLGISSSWVNINKTLSSSNVFHNHEGILSGVFYLKAPEGSGKLVLQNPAINTLWSGSKFVKNRNEVTGELLNIIPVEGEIVIWPSYIVHGVLPNEKDVERISISFNIDGRKIELKNTPDATT